MALTLVRAYATVCLQVTVGRPLLLVCFPGGRRGSSRSMGVLLSVRNTLGKKETPQKSQNKILACMRSTVSKRSLAIQARGEVWQLCSLSCEMWSWDSYDCFTTVVEITSELSEEFVLVCGVPLLLTNYLILASAFPAPHLLKRAKVSVELETHDAGLAGAEVWYSGIKIFIIFWLMKILIQNSGAV